MQAAWRLLSKVTPRSMRHAAGAGGRRSDARVSRASRLRHSMPTRALPLSDMLSDPRLLAETIRLLVERSRMAFGLVIAAVLAFAVADAAVNGHVLGPLLAIAAFQIVAAGAGVIALRGAPSRVRAVAVPVVVLSLVFWSGAVSDVLSANAYPTLTMSLLAALVASALMPWGLWPQVVAAASMIGAGVTAFGV